MTLIYKINDLENKIPYKQWELLKKEFVEFAKEKKQLETNIGEVMEILNQPMLNYASCVKALDEIEEILKRGK